MRGPHVRFCERKEVGNLFPTFTYSIYKKAGKYLKGGINNDNYNEPKGIRGRN